MPREFRTAFPMLTDMRDITRLPKAHLHVHLESAIRWETLEEIGAASGIGVPSRPATFRGFREFADHNSLVRQCPAAASEAAAGAGVHLVHQCAGPESVREAITLGRAERLGHGIRVLEDDDLVAEVRERHRSVTRPVPARVMTGTGRQGRHRRSSAPHGRCHDNGLFSSIRSR